MYQLSRLTPPVDCPVHRTRQHFPLCGVLFWPLTVLTGELHVQGGAIQNEISPLHPSNGYVPLKTQRKTHRGGWCGGVAERDRFYKQTLYYLFKQNILLLIHGSHIFLNIKLKDFQCFPHINLSWVGHTGTLKGGPITIQVQLCDVCQPSAMDDGIVYQPNPMN